MLKDISTNVGTPSLGIADLRRAEAPGLINRIFWGCLLVEGQFEVKDIEAIQRTHLATVK